MIRSATLAISSRPKTPTTWSTSGTASRSISRWRSAQAAGDDDPLEQARPLAVEHLVDHAQRFLPGRVDEAAGVDDDQVGLLRVRDQDVAILREEAEHPLGVDQVLGATQAHETRRLL